jgi:hypothetical protein
MSNQFSVDRNILNKAILKVLKACHSLFLHRYIEEFQNENPTQVPDYPEALLIVDATINRIQNPSGTLEGKKIF